MPIADRDAAGWTSESRQPRLPKTDIDGPTIKRSETAGSRRVSFALRQNAGHDPGRRDLIPRHKHNVGQPLGAFVDLAFIHGLPLHRIASAMPSSSAKPKGTENELPTLAPDKAYADFLNHLPQAGREWLDPVNSAWSRRSMNSRTAISTPSNSGIFHCMRGGLKSPMNATPPCVARSSLELET